MKVLVTGGAGFIGSHVVDAYLAAGWDVAIVDNLSTGRRSNLNPGARFHEVDIRSKALWDVLEQERPDLVNHHAAQMSVRDSVADPVYDADVNIMGSLNLLEGCRRSQVRRIVYISSGGAVYGEPVYLPCDEGHPVNPICPYGVSKHVVEHYLFQWRATHGLEYQVLRYPNVYGPRQDPQGEAGVVAIFTGQMLADEAVVINGDGEQQRDFVFVGDCARANLMALEAGRESGIFNLGSGRGTSVNEIFAALSEITGYRRPARHGPPKLGETLRIYLSAEHARLQLGWAPEVDLQQGLAQTVDYFRAQGERRG